ncbi:MAG TPA: SemiSWEET family transporter [Candidatus Acidoferrales bacterium]
MGIAVWIGSLAALCTTLSFVPQIFKIKKQGGADLSFGMLFIYLSGCLLWLAYGLMIGAPAIIWANAVTSVLVIVGTFMKVTHPNRRAALAAADSSASNEVNAAAAAAASAPVSSPAAPRELRVAATNVAPQSAIAPTPRKLRIAVDMDEVIADAFGKTLRAYNARTGSNITKEQIAREGLDTVFGADGWTPEMKAVFQDMHHDRTFFADLELMEGGQEALRELSADFEIFIASAAMDVPSSFDAKYQWLKQYFPFIPSSHYVFCGDKSILNADFLVDDRPRHFEHFIGAGILFTAPHNVGRPAALRADNWGDVTRILREAQAAHLAAASAR